MVRRRVIVEGRVQGVFFRAECRREAQSLGLAGWVRNRADGTVEAVFEGTAEQVEAIIAWAGHGPPTAVVEGVEVVAEEPEGLVGFTIRDR
ncbi:acylphosphatase [Glycomyces luteolus]|uniref:Acylphosphatase n=1 Tax=Glycomyces luteolus TaxID=2670330 RepID=A0A9X3SRM4_9ACTN|nr:acylphosphatase [Glycomyces luteolus]MDA1360059.1 acylphosphatase [Glycomyces luteolus]